MPAKKPITNAQLSERTPITRLTADALAGLSDPAKSSDENFPIARSGRGPTSIRHDHLTVAADSLYRQQRALPAQ